ncbi:hypothetical protein LJE82_12940, partial [bacterium BMS3Abin03]|nr:hypothetical protein [bacterium BMS3Abin03]
DPAPCPPPVYRPAPPHQPDPPKEKIRNPEPETRPGSSYDRSQRDKLRHSGSRNNTDQRNR